MFPYTETNKAHTLEQKELARVWNSGDFGTLRAGSIVKFTRGMSNVKVETYGSVCDPIYRHSSVNIKCPQITYMNLTHYHFDTYVNAFEVL